MQRTILALGAGALYLAASLPALSQQVVTEHPPGLLLADWVIGSNVENPAGETVARVDDLVIDHEDGRIEAVVLAVGGILGFGAKNVAVPYEDFTIRHDANEIVLDTTRDQLDQVAEFEPRPRVAPPPPPAATGAPVGTAPAPMQ
jgi:hypothetical protein